MNHSSRMAQPLSQPWTLSAYKRYARAYRHYIAVQKTNSLATASTPVKCMSWQYRNCISPVSTTAADARLGPSLPTYPQQHFGQGNLTHCRSFSPVNAGESSASSMPTTVQPCRQSRPSPCQVPYIYRLAPAAPARGGTQCRRRQPLAQLIASWVPHSAQRASLRTAIRHCGSSNAPCTIQPSVRTPCPASRIHV